MMWLRRILRRWLSGKVDGLNSATPVRERMSDSVTLRLVPATNGTVLILEYEDPASTFGTKTLTRIVSDNADTVDEIRTLLTLKGLL
jgi:hypothetical protein